MGAGTREFTSRESPAHWLSILALDHPRIIQHGTMIP